MRIKNWTTCMECGASLDLKVCSSAAGKYVGTFCDNCGPHSRDSHYMDQKGAEAWLRSWAHAEGMELSND